MLRRARLWPWCFLLILTLGISGLILWSLWPSVSASLSASFQPVSPAPSPRLVEGERRHVQLFFPQESGQALREQGRELIARATLGESVRDVVRALAAGGPGLRSPLPPGAEVRQVFLDDVGILYLDFTKEIQITGSAGGPQAEAALAALVTTITTNFGQVKRVRLLAEGREVAEVAGGVDLRRPILPRLPGEEVTPSTVPADGAEASHP